MRVSKSSMPASHWEYTDWHPKQCDLSACTTSPLLQCCHPKAPTAVLNHVDLCKLEYPDVLRISDHWRCNYKLDPGKVVSTEHIPGKPQQRCDIGKWQSFNVLPTCLAHMDTYVCVPMYAYVKRHVYTQSCINLISKCLEKFPHVPSDLVLTLPYTLLLPKRKLFLSP
jgi:hypothetical protein